MRMPHYNFILAGGGMAGLSLAHYLSREPALRQKRILLIDRAPKTRNDRTWAFWERGVGPFESLLHRSWETVWFHGPRGDGPRGDGPDGSQFSQKLDLDGYRYKLLRGIDFYQFVQGELAQCPNVDFHYSPIVRVGSDDRRGTAETEAGTFTADWVFDSTFRLEAMRPFDSEFRIQNGPSPGSEFRLQNDSHQTLLQHFKGWVVKTEVPAFDPAEPTMMDFRIAQPNGECRFLYVLPISETEALVEFTLFTPALLRPDEYDEALRGYLAEFLNIRYYTVSEEEFGIIPMTDEPTTERPSPRVVRIGTAGGATRPSTGYTFARTQRHLQTLTQNLVRYGQPFAPGGTVVPIPKRYLLYDRIFLNVFLNRRARPADIFTQLYQRNRAADVFRFLDEENSFLRDLPVMWAVPKWPFVRAALDVLFGGKPAGNAHPRPGKMLPTGAKTSPSL